MSKPPFPLSRGEAPSVRRVITSPPSLSFSRSLMFLPLIDVTFGSELLPLRLDVASPYRVSASLFLLLRERREPVSSLLSQGRPFSSFATCGTTFFPARARDRASFPLSFSLPLYRAGRFLSPQTANFPQSKIDMKRPFPPSPYCLASSGRAPFPSGRGPRSIQTLLVLDIEPFLVVSARSRVFFLLPYAFSKKAPSLFSFSPGELSFPVSPWVIPGRFLSSMLAR